MLKRLSFFLALIAMGSIQPGIYYTHCLANAAASGYKPGDTPPANDKGIGGTKKVFEYCSCCEKKNSGWEGTQPNGCDNAWTMPLLYGDC